LGALLLRVTFIVSGAALVQRFHWIMYLFGAFLVFTGAKLLFHDDEEMDPERNLMLRFLRKWVPSVATYRGSAFVVIEGGKRYATPLLFVLFVIEATDIVFAVDSIPAIFAVTQDPFIIYSSNIFAILGLRALFFALAAVMDKFHYLKVGLCFVLVFVGGKMLIVDFYKVPIGLSLSLILGILGASVLASLLAPKPANAAVDVGTDSDDQSG
jgi:tellurite resistance protein TerC